MCCYHLTLTKGCECQEISNKQMAECFIAISSILKHALLEEEERRRGCEIQKVNKPSSRKPRLTRFCRPFPKEAEMAALEERCSNEPKCLEKLSNLSRCKKVMQRTREVQFLSVITYTGVDFLVRQMPLSYPQIG